MTGVPGRRRGAAGLLASVVVGLVAGLVVGLVAGLAVAAGWLGLRSGTAPAWTATTSLAIMPTDDIDRWAAASAAEALSTGQVAATAAEILRSPRIVADAAHQQGLLDVAGAGVTVTVAVVPGTAVLRVAVSAPARAVAEATAEALPRAGAAYLRTISWPYRLVTVASAGAAAVAPPSRRGAPVVLAVAALAALAALAAQQAWYRFRIAGRRTRPQATAEEARG